jgi:predicted transposase/invertase (TIGR01784 family)
MNISDILLIIHGVKGNASTIALLIEQQHANDSHFGDRMHDSMVRLSVQNQYKRTMAFVLYTGDSKNVKSHKQDCFGSGIIIYYKSFHLLSCDVKELLRDESPFALVMYTALGSYKCGDDLTLREKFGQEILNMTLERSYSETQKFYILEFARTILRLKSDEISENLKEDYMKKVKSFEDPNQEIHFEIFKEMGIEEGREIGREEGREETFFEVARKMLAEGIPVETIKKCTDLDEKTILSLK